MAKVKEFDEDEDSEKIKGERCRVLKSGLDYDSKKYEFSDAFKKANTDNPLEVHTVHEMVEHLKKNKNSDIDAKVLCREKGSGRWKYKRLNKESFLNEFKKQRKLSSFKFGEHDSFGSDGDFAGSIGPLVGKDFIPLLSGPFYKQLYNYDYLRMHAASFHAYHHDSYAKRGVNIIRDFTLGRGFRVDCDNDAALALWRTFEEVNKLYQLMDYATIEHSIYGEIMLWELPNLQTKISFDKKKPVPVGHIPRIRLIDPSVIWDICTYPEDIDRVLFYQWVAPTQWQLYTHQDGGETVPGSRFIFQQIPAEQVMHFKLNCVSNEKRGRSILFPILGDLKRLRDTTDYKILAEQKNAAWAIDTSIEGSQADIDYYCDEQKKLGSIPNAASEFVHTAKVKREYRSNTTTAGATKGGTYDEVLSKIATGFGIPVSYFGTANAAGQTKGSAIVSTEPVAKMLEHRQMVLETIIKTLATRLFKRFGFEGEEIEVTFPTIVEQDRSAKLKDLALAEDQLWLSHKRCAAIAAKELGVTEYEYEEELQDIRQEQAAGEYPAEPLTTPGIADMGAGSGEGPGGDGQELPQTSAVTQADRTNYTNNARQ
jgi:hypothetical protein